MNVRLRLLPIGVALVAAVVAGCSSTTTESTGAVQDEVSMAPASSSAASSPGELPSTASSAGQMLGSTASGDVCDSGLTYACGDTGPGGGTVFYASSTAFACGAGMASSCNFLEAAPNLWAPNSQSSCRSAGGSCGGSAQQTSDFAFSGKGITLCTGSGEKLIIASAEAMAIGSGYANTTALLPLCNPGDAPNAARSYNGGGMTDWSVPSADELTALFSYPNRNAMGGFPPSKYWSSSTSTSNSDVYSTIAVTVNFGSEVGSKNFLVNNVKSNPYGLRPVRAF